MRKVLAAFLMIWANVAQADEVVIAALGDSLTQGFGLVQEDGFVPQLHRWLAAEGADVRLINAGVSGDTTAGGLARADWTFTPEVDGVIVTLGGNDLLRGLAPTQARANIEGILRKAQAADIDVLLIGLQAPGNFGPAYKSQFDSIYPELAEEYGTLYMQSFFAGLSEAGQPQDPASLRRWFQSDGIHPNAKGVARIVDAVGPSVLELIERAR